MHAWLCENPIGVEALQWKELPTPRAEGRRGARRDPRREPELPRPADRAEQVPDEAAAALRAGLRVRRASSRRSARREAPEGRRCGGRVRRHRRLRHARLRQRRAGACRCRRASRSTTRPPSSSPTATTHHALLDRARAEGRRDACSCWARPAASARRRSRSPRRPAHASSPRRRATRSASSAARSAPTRPSTTPARNMRDELKELTDGKGPDVVYDPVGGDLAEPVVPLDRLARPLPGHRLRAGRRSRRCR